MSTAELPSGDPATRHLSELRRALDPFSAELPRLARWGRHLARELSAGRRLLVAGNGGSAAEAQHLTAELVGRYRHDRAPLSALSLHADTSSVTAIANDFGVAELFARQVRAHGRAGDALMVLSTSGRSENLLAAARAGHQQGLTVWAMTGRAPNPLTGLVDDSLVVDSEDGAAVQELHLVAIHLLCEHVDQWLDPEPAGDRAAGGQAAGPSRPRDRAAGPSRPRPAGAVGR